MDLFLIYSKSNFNFMKQIAVFFKKKNHKISFLLASEIFKKKINITKDTEVFLYKDILDTSLRQQIKIRNNFFKLFVYYLWSMSLVGKENFKIINDKNKKFLFKSANFLLSKKIKKIFVCEDGIGSDFNSIILLSAAKYLKIPIYNIPFGSGTEEDIEFSLKTKQSQKLLIKTHGFNLLLSKLFLKKWLKKGKFKNVIMYPLELIISMEMNQISLRNPWIINGGYASKIFAENDISKNQYISEGINRERIVNSGSPYSDYIYNLKRIKTIKKTIRTNKLILKNKVSILISWPPNYFDYDHQNKDFKNYENFIELFLNFLISLKNVCLNISFHPGVSENEKKLFKSYNLNIKNEWVLNLIPKNDIYLSYASSLIRWSLLAGKVAVNYDLYNLNLNYQPWKKVEMNHGYYCFNRFEDLKKKIIMLTSNVNNLKKILKLQSNPLPNLGLFDGKCLDRIHDNIYKKNVQKF